MTHISSKQIISTGNRGGANRGKKRQAAVFADIAKRLSPKKPKIRVRGNHVACTNSYEPIDEIRVELSKVDDNDDEDNSDY